MLTGMSRLRWKAALSLALLYAFCILMPHAALAVTGAAHCLTEPHAAAPQAAAKVHVHSDGVAHTHSDEPADRSVPQDHSQAVDKSGCCGLFCISALAQETGSALPEVFKAVRTSPAFDDARAGRAPDRIHRPPIA